MAEGERQKNKRLLKGYRELALRKKGEELLAILPQGEGSGLDADMVDGMHAEQIIAEALKRIGFPKKGRATFGGGGMTVHGNEMHTPNFHAVGDIFADAQYPNALLLSGIRGMTGNLVPESDYGANLGIASKRWNEVRALYGVIESWNVNVKPRDTYVALDLGVDPDVAWGEKWRDLWLSRAGYMASLNETVTDAGVDIPTAGDITGLAGKTLNFPTIETNLLYAEYLMGNILTFITQTRHLWPGADITSNIGDSTRRYLNGYIRNLYSIFVHTNIIAERTPTFGVTIDGLLLKDGGITVSASKILNFGSNPILYTPLKHICPFVLDVGVTDVFIETIAAGWLTQDLHVDKIGVALDQPPGDGKSVTVNVSDGTNTMTVTITGAVAKTGSTTTNNFDLDVSAESLTLEYSQDAGGAATRGSITCLFHLITNV